jgi:hypothetical protein
MYNFPHLEFLVLVYFLHLVNEDPVLTLTLAVGVVLLFTVLLCTFC